MSGLSRIQNSSDVVAELVPKQGPPDSEANVSGVDNSTHKPEGLLAKRVLFVEARVLVRDCLVRAIRAANEMSVLGAASVEEALEKSTQKITDLFLLSISGAPDAADLGSDIARLISVTGSPVAVLADGYNMDEVGRVFEMGATGYISTNLPFEVSIGAIRLLLAGGKFIPANMLLEARRIGGSRMQTPDKYKRMFTERQVDVLEALSKGKANKEIARDLKMREGTVKVHVRNLMKLLSAHNRTEVALVAVDILQSCAVDSSSYIKRSMELIGVKHF